MNISMPEMLTGYNLKSELEQRPYYDDSIRTKTVAERLFSLSDIYSLYIPSQMSVEIYNKLYLALMHSLQKKNTKQAVMQQNENRKMILGREHNGIIGGSDSFTIIGVSGIGKSSAIQRAIRLISKNEVIYMPETVVIPFVTVQCPFDSSVKGLLLEILRQVDDTIGSHYYNNAVRARATTDMLIGSVSQVAINHIGAIVVDEIQNVCKSKYGRNLVGMLTQLINNSGVSICMVGTPECSSFFEQEIQLARRALGLKYSELPFNEYFQDFCEEVFSYQYTKCRSEITPSIVEWLYEHSGGITSVVVSLIHDAQEIAILEGKEELNLETLNEAYSKRMEMMYCYVNFNREKIEKPKKQKQEIPPENDVSETVILDCVKVAKSTGVELITLLKCRIAVEEIAL